MVDCHGAEVAWIVNGTSMGRAITAAIPPVFEAYATVVLPCGDEQASELGPELRAPRSAGRFRSWEGRSSQRIC